MNSLGEPDVASSAIDDGYRVLITERSGGYELRIRELQLTVRGPSLERAYDDLMIRKRKIVEWARSLDALDELPTPEPPPPVGGRVEHRLGAIGAALPWLERILSKIV
jgi:hypothetical protein